ncbi:uncharacterized protein B0H18DRAFT_1123945 [Fomitopsis serialis]|uniref:uncharacterized protein n=1 Tax=Fomitopsis serialis TaxID=139415 RepID=UPI0020082FD5|nr:uncharacterized protein B0H18DRAFT_1123945 [Neoantrodia serialis]KAH9916875.1 hypothetical protein B0H18DRAFT_1123945 [Neoantrodia serialis]
MAFRWVSDDGLTLPNYRLPDLSSTPTSAFGTMVANIQLLNEDVLSVIRCVPLATRRWSARLDIARDGCRRPPRVLSSLRVATPSRSLDFHDFILGEDGYRLQYMRKLAIPLPHIHDSGDEFSLLAAVLVRARNLRSLDVVYHSDRGALATEGGRALCDAIVLLHDLREFALCGVTEDTMALCKKLACKPKVVRLEAQEWTAEPLQDVDYATLIRIPFLQHAAEVFMAYLALLPKPAPDWSALWPSTRTLRLRNMDPLALVRLCPNLACLHIAFTPMVDNSGFIPDDRLFRYTTSFAHDVTARLRVLEVFVNHQWSTLKEPLITTVRATHPVVFSTQYYEGDREFWGRLAELFERSDARLRYLDLLMHNTVALAHGWLSRAHPSRVPAPRLSPEAGPSFNSRNWKWEPLRDAAPRLLAEGIPTLRYVAVSSSGYMAQDTDDPGCSSFRGSPRWWRVVSDVMTKTRAVELIEIGAEEGQRLDEYMRSEAFADTLQL